MMSAVVGSRGQVTIPKEFRNIYGFEGVVYFIPSDRGVEIVTKDMLIDLLKEKYMQEQSLVDWDVTLDDGVD